MPLVPAYLTSLLLGMNWDEKRLTSKRTLLDRRAFGLEQVELREFEADSSVEALDLNANRATLDNIRLWDWRALQDTLKQIQAIRTYYDFPDVDVDRYGISGTTRQMMIAAREIDLKNFPRFANWIK